MNLADMPTLMAPTLSIDPQIDAACGRIAPLWPLKNFVAVNPFFGLRDHDFQSASHLLHPVWRTRLYMPRSYFQQ